jgi:hypothetical protein
VRRPVGEDARRRGGVAPRGGNLTRLRPSRVRQSPRGSPARAKRRAEEVVRVRELGFGVVSREQRKVQGFRVPDVVRDGRRDGVRRRRRRRSATTRDAAFFSRALRGLARARGGGESVRRGPAAERRAGDVRVSVFRVCGV